jgi:hypothetical protein
MELTPKQKAIAILESTKGDNAYRARMAFRGLSPERMQELYGDSGETRQAILDGYEKEEREHLAALEWVKAQKD